ncbi:diacylglycerol kinase, partial [Thiolapillus sp.]|uniref:diacylglycerol kinase n=1 Tax=Thiolapillus sp. TaxID=2017437 RepID=UPI003AF4367D
FSLAGFRAVWRHEEAFRLEILLFVITTPLAVWLTESGVERLLLIGSIVLVLIVELLNSAVEAVVDRIGLEQHELSGRAKDIGSAAVTTALAWAAATWLITKVSEFILPTIFCCIRCPTKPQDAAF